MLNAGPMCPSGEGLTAVPDAGAASRPGDLLAPPVLPCHVVRERDVVAQTGLIGVSPRITCDDGGTQARGGAPRRDVRHAVLQAFQDPSRSDSGSEAPAMDAKS
jgi:hypothetical protein